MEIVNAVVAALAAGTAVGFTDTASAAVRDGYNGVKASVGRLLRRRRGDADEAELEEQLSDPKTHREELAAALADADETEREEVRAAAEHFLGMVRSAHHDHRKILLWNSPGSAAGDHATVTNTNININRH
jgi:hypothetical protein